MRGGELGRVSAARGRPGMRRGGLFWGALAVLAVAGACSGGRLRFIEVNFKRIDAVTPLVEDAPADEGYWWVEEGRLCVALHRRQAGLLSEAGTQTLDLSLVLEGLPVDKARDYPLDRNSMRAYLGHGAQHRRFASLQGLAAVRLAPGECIRGRFRLLAKEQMFHILTGWNDFGQAIMAGEFRARHDPTRGRAILESTERDGMARSAARTPSGEGRAAPAQVTGPAVGAESPPATSRPGGP